ncbi:MAG TPA: DUF3179 domain-containing protein, partial [Rhizobiales bacterium]|nr:DUF3179 domain-containing protein [Hyphomicrobiales bacterium]
MTALPASAGEDDIVRRFRAMGWTSTDFSRKTIALDEIISGGVSKDQIPAIDRPVFARLSKVKDIAGREPVVSLKIANDARAYPLRVMIWHEIVNDTVGGVPVAVTYCPLCNSAIAFRRT